MMSVWPDSDALSSPVSNTCDEPRCAEPWAWECFDAVCSYGEPHRLCEAHSTDYLRGNLEIVLRPSGEPARRIRRDPRAVMVDAAHSAVSRLMSIRASLIAPIALTQNSQVRAWAAEDAEFAIEILQNAISQAGRQ